MALAVAHSRGLDGLNAPPVLVEAHLASGLPAFTLVGLPDTEVKEARDRVRAAIVNSGFEFPQKRITVLCHSTPVGSSSIRSTRREVRASGFGKSNHNQCALAVSLSKS